MSDKPKMPFKDVSPQVNVDELEKGILAYWDEKKIFEKSLEQTKDGEVFTFYDGPPYATGKPHYGHVLQSSLKDTVLRYKTMQGYHVPRRVGWDCHGLPVEVLVEKELKLKGKRDIEAMGIEAFNAQCREMVFRYIDEFTNTLKRMGRWADYDNYYATLNKDYMETEWWVFKQLWDQGLVYKDFRTTPYCIRCATPLSNFEVSMAYKDKVDTAVYVLLKAKGKENLYVMIWSTTPWTLPANVAVAYSPELAYVSVEHPAFAEATAGEGRKEIIVAKDRVEAVFGNDAKVVKEWTKQELEEIRYEPLYTLGDDLVPASSPVEKKQKDLFTKKAELYSLVPGEHVTAEDGTGLAHTAWSRHRTTHQALPGSAP